MQLRMDGHRRRLNVEWLAHVALTEHELPVTQIDRERNYQLKMETEACFRRLEGAKRVRKG